MMWFATTDDAVAFFPKIVNMKATVTAERRERWGSRPGLLFPRVGDAWKHVMIRAYMLFGGISLTVSFAFCLR